MKQGRKEDRYPRWVGIHLAWASQWRGVGGAGAGVWVSLCGDRTVQS